MNKNLLRYKFIILLYMSIGTNIFAQNIHTKFDAVLKKYVVSGQVDYQKLKEDRAGLDSYLQDLEIISEATFKQWNTSEQLAYLINLYNAATLRLIIDNYPLKSIKKISFFKSPWDIKTLVLFGKKVSLNHLEHDIIRVQYNEPRIHVALVCAAKGCPILRSTTYTGEKLEQQLEEQMHLFLSNSTKNRIDSNKNRIYLSPIFKWYKKDFEKQSSLLEYIKKYWDSLPTDYANYSISYTHYDWSLNKQ